MKMETIRNYLETMFLNLPRTPEVMRAKLELGQMMEDKYNELIAEGKMDNEATGIVISEFGNLEELAEELGILDYMKKGNFKERETVSMETIKSFISEKTRSSVRMAIGVLLCILSPVGVIFFQAIAMSKGMSGGAADAAGLLFLFLLVAAGVGCIVYDCIRMGKWQYLKGDGLVMDFATETYVREQRENFQPTYALYITLGVVCCIVSVIPSAVIGTFLYDSVFLGEISGAFVLVFVAIGVMFFIMGAKRKSGYEVLLVINPGAGERMQENEDEEPQSELERNVMSVYWPTIVCLYLIWSFLTMSWHITWIIWPIAGVMERVVRIICREIKR